MIIVMILAVSESTNLRLRRNLPGSGGITTSAFFGARLPLPWPLPLAGSPRGTAGKRLGCGGRPCGSSRATSSRSTGASTAA